VEEARIVVTGMTCPHCAAQVKRVLEGLAPGLSAEVDLAAGVARLSGERLPGAPELAAALKVAGFSGGERADA
jgi:copper chaperone CopZ